MMRRRGGGGGRCGGGGGGGVVEMRYNMGIEHKFRGEEGRQTIVASEIRDNGDIGDGYMVIWRWRQRQRRRTCNRIYYIDAA